MKQPALKSSLVLLTIISVVCDTMILPFYPQFFSAQFGLQSSNHIGAYIAVCCITVMCAFPVWAKIAQHVHELYLWVITQIMAGLLGVACFYSENVWSFWLLSQLMLVFKASYLLIYPFVLSIEEKQQHLGVVALFSVLLHFGGIGGALLGGLIIQSIEPRFLYLVMAAGDCLQVMLCLYLIYLLKVSYKPRELTASSVKRQRFPGYIIRLGVISMGVYFSMFLATPYFTLLWQQVSDFSNALLAGAVFAIPAWVALVILITTKNKPATNQHSKTIAYALMLSSIGLFIQLSSHWQWLVLGRVVFAIGLFLLTVRLQVMLFAMSEPRFYSSDFAKLHFMQNIGVICASFLAGDLVSRFELNTPLLTGSVGFAITLCLFYLLFLRNKHTSTDPIHSY